MHDVIRGLQVLDTNLKMMAVQLSNRNIMLVDLWNEIYFQDKRDDINMKLKDHELILKSLEERARLSQMSM